MTDDAQGALAGALAAPPLPDVATCPLLQLGYPSPCVWHWAGGACHLGFALAVGAPLLLRWPRGNPALAPAGQARLWACTTAAAVVVLAFLARAFLAVAGDAEFGLNLHAGTCACARARHEAEAAQTAVLNLPVFAPRDLMGQLARGRAPTSAPSCCC